MNILQKYFDILSTILTDTETTIPGTITTMQSDVTEISDTVLPGDHHEKIYPFNSSGVTVTPGNTVWGNVFKLVGIDDIKDDYGWGTGSITTYNLVGFTYLLSAGANKPNTVQFLRIVKVTETVLSNDCTAGDTALLMADTSDFLAGDIVWVADTVTPNGELCYVNTITANTSLNTAVLATAGIPATIANNYTTGNSAKVYLVRRAGVNAYRTIWDKFGHGDTKSVIRHDIHLQRKLASGDGLLVRAFGIDDATGVMLVSVIFDDNV